MRIAIVLAVVLAAAVSPAFAAGNLNVTGVSMAPAFINTRVMTSMLNISLNSTGGMTNVTGVNVTISGTAPIGNVTAVSILNSTGSVIGVNTTNSSSAGFTVFVTQLLNVTDTSNTTIIIAVNISSSAAALNTTGISLNPNANLSFFTADTVGVANVTYVPGSSNSSLSQVQDVHANASISPRIVDTSVINQTLIYTITPTGANTINRTVINAPAGYQIVDLVNVTTSGSSCLSGICTERAFNSTQISVNFSSPFVNTTANNPIIINFTVNTSSSPATGLFTSVISGSNLTDASTDVVSNQTNVTTKQILNVTGIGVMKTVAIVNDTDYWEFNFTISVADPVSGLLQFKMTNWSSTEGYGIALQNSTAFFASVRNAAEFNATSKVNVTNEYNVSGGLRYTSFSGTINLFLRMIIPARDSGGTGTRISQSWFTTYGMLFRATP